MRFLGFIHLSALLLLAPAFGCGYPEDPYIFDVTPNVIRVSDSSTLVVIEVAGLFGLPVKKMRQPDLQLSLNGQHMKSLIKPVSPWQINWDLGRLGLRGNHWLCSYEFSDPEACWEVPGSLRVWVEVQTYFPSRRETITKRSNVKLIALR